MNSTATADGLKSLWKFRFVPSPVSRTQFLFVYASSLQEASKIASERLAKSYPHLSLLDGFTQFSFWESNQHCAGIRGISDQMHPDDIFALAADLDQLDPSQLTRAEKTLCNELLMTEHSKWLQLRPKERIPHRKLMNPKCY